MYSMYLGPYDPAQMPDHEALDDYPTEGTEATLHNYIDTAIAESDARNIPLWCGEFGTVLWYAPRADRVAWYGSIASYMTTNNIAWTAWELRGGFGLTELEHGGDFDFHHDLNVEVLTAMGFNPPAQTDWVIEEKTSAFDIFTDEMASGIQFDVFTKPDGMWLMFDESSTVKSGSHSIYWAEAKSGENFSFDFAPNLDLAMLKNAYSIEFWVRGDTPSLKFSVKLLNSYHMEDGLYPYGVSHTVTEANSGASWDRQWHKVKIPLTAMIQKKAAVGGHSYPNDGDDFRWHDVSALKFSTADGDFGSGSFYIDDIKIVPTDMIR